MCKPQSAQSLEFEEESKASIRAEAVGIDFGASITNPAPALTNLGHPGSLAFPTGMWPVFDGTNWSIFIVNRLSQTLGTIPYEILTSVSARVKRVYLQE